ncbi:MAG: glutamyl-tRNA reductase [Bacteroidetes bacterium]|nr:glutamyl-tRNA reductase [Bacteroidota bacterium]
MLKLTAVSINHRTANVEAREKIFYSSEEVRGISEKIKSAARESFIVSTCNRTELYIIPSSAPQTHDNLYHLVREGKRLDDGELQIEYETFEGFEAVRHLFSVATGIDSLMLGDIQILGQMKDAYNTGVELGMVGTIMHHACQIALKAGKRAKSETKISEGAVSVSYAAVELAEKIFGNLKGRTAMLIGAGEAAELAAKDLKPKGIGKLYIANRTLERAQNLVEHIGFGEAMPLDALTQKLSQVDIVISSVGGTNYVLTRDMVAAAMKGRESSPLLIIDIGVPRNVEPAVKKISNVFLNDIDSLNLIVEKNLDMRRAEIPAVRRVVDEEVNDFIKWYNSLEVGPTIKMLRDKIEQIRTDEVKRYKNKMNGTDVEIVEEVTRSLVNKILHEPLTNLKNAENGISLVDRVKLLKSLFGLSEGSGGEEDEKG